MCGTLVNRGTNALLRGLGQGCTNPGRQIAMATEFFFTLAPNMCGPSVWNLLYVVLMAPRILRWLLDVWKICVPLA
jgi:hypothetical protein